jgi:hypothetical protein
MQFRFLSLYLVAVLAISGIISIPQARASDPSNILVNMAPQNPDPGDNVTITLNSYANNLDSVLISWYANGKIVASGTGKKSFSITAPAAGAEIEVIAKTYLPEGSMDTRMVIRPAVMVLLWQAMDSYVPPFYRGKALPTPDSVVKVVAMPEVRVGSNLVDPNNMVYAWKQDYTNDQNGSGYGKNSFTYRNDYLDNSNNISVTASTVNQNYSSGANVDIATYQPKILFYKKDENMGTLWEQTLEDGHQIHGSEILQAAPYFISPQDIRIPTLIFSWFINDEQVAVPDYKKSLMPLQAQAGVSGTSKIKLRIDNSDKIFETAEKEIKVNF